MRITATKKFFVIFLATVLTFAVMFTARKDRPPAREEPTTAAGPADSNQPGAAEELVLVLNEHGEPLTTAFYDNEGNLQVFEIYVPKQQTAAEPPISPVEDPSEIDSSSSSNNNFAPQENRGLAEAIRAVDALNGGAFHLAGRIGESKIEIMVSGSNFYLSGEMDGISLGMATINGARYFLNPKNSTYIELTEAMQPLLADSIDSLEAEVPNLTDIFKGKLNPSQEPEVTAVTIGGKPHTRYTYDFTAGSIRLHVYLEGERVVRIDTVSDSETSTIIIEKLVGGISPGDIKIPANYKSVNILAFAAALGLS